MGAEDGVGVAVGDELAKPVRMAFRHQTDEVGIPADSHGDVVITSGLVLSHADRTVLEVGEAAARHHIMNGLAGGAADGIPRRDAPFGPGSVDQAGAAVQAKALPRGPVPGQPAGPERGGTGAGPLFRLVLPTCWASSSVTSAYSSLACIADLAPAGPPPTRSSLIATARRKRRGRGCASRSA